MFSITILSAILNGDNFYMQVFIKLDVSFIVEKSNFELSEVFLLVLGETSFSAYRTHGAGAASALELYSLV